MSLPLRAVRAAPRGAVWLIAAAAVIAAAGGMHAEDRAVCDVPVSITRTGPGSLCGDPPLQKVHATALPAVRVHSGITSAVQGNSEQELEVTCRVQDDPDARVFKLRPSASPPESGRRWQLSMRDRETKDAWIQLALPGAVPTMTRESAKLTYRNANGGRQVDLEVGPGASRLDVWVDYGLEVNIEPDLDPRVDRLNTHGPLTAVACTIGAAEPD